MTDNPEKKDESTVEKPETKEEENTEEKAPENDGENFVWADKNGKKPISYILPIYVGVGVVFLIIWILIIVFAIQPAWDDYEASKKPGLEIDVAPSADTEGDNEDSYTDNLPTPEDGSTGNQSRPNN